MFPELTAEAGSSPPSGIECRLAHRILTGLDSPGIAIRLWNGEQVGHGSVATIGIHDRATFWRLCIDPAIQFGEAYSAGRLTVDGDLVAVLEATFRTPAGNWLRRTVTALRGRPRRNTLSRSRRNVHRHYDLGDDFYRLWLDRDLVYTCAYFATPTMTLEQAQDAKAELVCRKLRLQPGQRVVEAGSGWGGLALYMARKYGVRVDSYNISEDQVRYARDRSQRLSLDDRVHFVEDDYRNIRGRFDAFVSVGMLEHVGKANYAELGRVIERCLEPEGLALIHTIGRHRPMPLNPWIQRRIFPGAYPPTLGEMAGIFEPNFAILDVENLRLHYAITLEHWLERFESSRHRVRAMFDDNFERTWRLYLSGSIAGFRAGTLQLFQVLFSRAGVRHLPMTRRHLDLGDESAADDNCEPQRDHALL